METQTQFVTREDYNYAVAQNQIVGKAEMMPTTTRIDALMEATIDQGIYSKGKKPVYDYAIPTASTEDVSYLQASYRVSLKKLRYKRDVTPDPNANHNYELPGKLDKPSDVKLSTLKLRRRADNPVTYNPDHIPRDYRSQNLGIHFDGYGADENETFTRTKLLQARKYANKIQEDELKDKFEDIKREMYQDSNVPFWQRDAAYHYSELVDVPEDKQRQAFGTFSNREIELCKTGKIENKDLQYQHVEYKALSKQRQYRLEEQVNYPRLAQIDEKYYDDNLKTYHPKRTHFATAVLKQKNPEWQLLRVKSTMTGDEDKPLYSSFAPDGFYRELLMPQIRAPSRGSRQVPQQLRGMVRVMQLPIVAEVSQLLDTESDRLPGDTRILTRPSIFE